MRDSLLYCAALCLLLVTSILAQPNISLSLDGPVSAAEASSVLTTAEVRAIANANGMALDTVQHILSHSKDLVVTASGELVYVCDGLPVRGATAAQAANASTAIVGDIPVLHSRRGAPKVIFLDFDGHRVEDTRWQGTLDIPAFDIPPTTCPDVGCDRAAFLQSIWHRVREFFWHLNIDVTTEEPPIAMLRGNGVRVAVGGDGSFSIQFALKSGAAFLHSFAWKDTNPSPAFCFPLKLLEDPKLIAECIAHEVGHTLGLSHDGQGAEEYYWGTEIWAPIMGVSFNAAIVQWSKGEYIGATNTEDDLALMLKYADLIGDTVPNSPNNALILEGNPTPGRPGRMSGVWSREVITSSNDSDCFQLIVGAGPWQFLAQPFILDENPGPSGNIILRLFDPTGVNVLATQNPSGPFSNQGALITGTAEVQTRLLFCVAGAGQGDQRTNGFSSYGSIGAYTVAAEYGAPIGISPTATSPRRQSPSRPISFDIPSPSPTVRPRLPDTAATAEALTCQGDIFFFVNTCPARNADSAPCNLDFNAFNGIWFVYDSKSPQVLEFSTCNAVYDTSLQVYTVPNGFQQPTGWDPQLPIRGECIGGNDDTEDYNDGTCSPSSSLFSFEAKALTRYYFLVGAWTTLSCGALEVTCSSTPITPSPAKASPSPAKASPRLPSPSPKASSPRVSPSVVRSPSPRLSPAECCACPSPLLRSPAPVSPRLQSPSPTKRSPSPARLSPTLPKSPVLLSPSPRAKSPVVSSPSPNRPKSPALPSPSPRAKSPVVSSPSPTRPKSPAVPSPSPRRVSPSVPTTMRPSPSPMNCNLPYVASHLEAELRDTLCRLNRFLSNDWDALYAEDPDRYSGLANQVLTVSITANTLYGVVTAVYTG